MWIQSTNDDEELQAHGIGRCKSTIFYSYDMQKLFEYNYFSFWEVGTGFVLVDIYVLLLEVLYLITVINVSNVHCVSQMNRNDSDVFSVYFVKNGSISSAILSNKKISIVCLHIASSIIVP